MTDTTGTVRAKDSDFRDWLIFCGLATIGTAVVVLANPGRTATGAAIAAALVVALQLVYWFLARPSLAGVREDSGRAWAFAAIALVGFSVAAILNVWASLALFALCPEFFLLLRPLAAAIGIALLNAAPLIAELAGGPLTTGDVVELVGTTLFIIVFAIFFSTRLLSVTRQSEARRRLIEQLREREEQVAALSAERGAAVERARIAREMHDTLAQGFTSIVTLGHAVSGELETSPDAARRHIALITETAQENLAESRRIIAALTPAGLDEASLAEALRRLVGRFQEETGVDASFQLDGAAMPAAAAVEVVLLRIGQECLANARKHARARRVDVLLSYRQDVVALSVTDDGAGFDVGAVSSGYGLAGMRARLAEVGGSLELSSTPGSGTSIRAVAPSANGGRR